MFGEWLSVSEDLSKLRNFPFVWFSNFILGSFMNRTLERINQYHESCGRSIKPYRIDSGSVDALLEWIAPWHEETETLLHYAKHDLPADPPSEDDYLWMNFLPSNGIDIFAVSVSELPILHAPGRDSDHALIKSGFLYIIQGAVEENVMLDIRTGKVLIIHIQDRFDEFFDGKCPANESEIQEFREEVYRTFGSVSGKMGCGALTVVDSLDAFDDLMVRFVKTKCEGELVSLNANFIDFFHDPEKFLLPL